MGGVAETSARFVTLTGCRLDNVLNSVITTRSLLVSSALAMCLFLGCGDSAMPKSPTSATASAPQIQHTKALSSSPTQVRTFTPDGRESALVTRVIDGDTVEVSLTIHTSHHVTPYHARSGNALENRCGPASIFSESRHRTLTK